MNIYLAGPWAERELMPGYASKLEAAGHTITHKWWEVEVEVDEEQWRDPTMLQEQAFLDVAGVVSADVVVLINSQKSEGKAVEQGIAIAHGIPILAVGVRGTVSKNVFHYLPCYEWVETLDDAVEMLKGD
jgi:nucleoside 2-deoxyribosyltransferase